MADEGLLPAHTAIVCREDLPPVNTESFQVGNEKHVSPNVPADLLPSLAISGAKQSVPRLSPAVGGVGKEQMFELRTLRVGVAAKLCSPAIAPILGVQDSLGSARYPAFLFADKIDTE